MAEKPYKSYNQQLRILRSRGLDTGNGSFATSVLKKENYYNIINGYNEIFLSRKKPIEIYKKGATFKQIYELYCFDRSLRDLILPIILKLEHQFKSAIAHEFSKKYNPKDQLKLENFSLGAPNMTSEQKMKVQQNVSELIARLHQDISRQVKNNHSSVCHYLTNTGHIPLWVLVNALTFNRISHFYANMKNKEKIEVAKYFPNITYQQLRSFIWILCDFRNVAAHNDRLYLFNSRAYIAPTTYHNQLFLNSTTGRKDFFAFLIILKHFLTKKDFSNLIKSIDSLLSSLESKIPNQINEVKKKMGFPSNWKDLRDL